MEMSTVDIRYCMTAWRRWWGGAADLLTLYALRRQKYGTRKLSLSLEIERELSKYLLPLRIVFVVYGYGTSTARLSYRLPYTADGCTMCCDGQTLRKLKHLNWLETRGNI